MAMHLTVMKILQTCMYLMQHVYGSLGILSLSMETTNFYQTQLKVTFFFSLGPQNSASNILLYLNVS